MSALLLYLIVAALILGALRRTRFAPSWLASGVLVAIAAIPSAGAHLRDRQMSNLDHFLHWEPWSSQRRAMELEITSSGITGDLTTAITPWAAEVREAWRSGVWPLWTSRQYAGTVLLGAAQPAPFFPDQVISLALPFELSFAFVYATRLFLAGLGAFLLLRQLEAAEGPALVAAAAWTYSSFHFFWLGWSLGATAGLFPLLLFATMEVTRRPSLASSSLLAFVLSAAALAGHPETLLHVVALSVLAFVVKLAVATAAPRGRAVAAALASGGVALLTSAAFLLPVAEAVFQSERWRAQRATAARDRPLPAISATLDSLSNTILPFANGVWDKELPKGPMPPEPFASAYVGSVGLALAVLGLTNAARKRVRLLLAAMTALGLVGGSNWAPAVALFRRLPMFDVSLNNRLYFAAALGFACLAGLGFEALSWRAEAARTKRQGLWRLALTTAGGSLAVALVLVAAAWVPLRADGLSVSFLSSQAALYVLPLLVLAAIIRYLARRQLAAAVLCVLLIVGQRLSESGHFHAGSTNAGSRIALDPGFQKWIPADDRPERIVGVGHVLIPNASGLLGLSDVRGYDPMVLARYSRTFGSWSAEQGGWFNRVDDLSPPFLDFLAVRWALVAPPTEVPPGWSEAAQDAGWQLLRNEEALPLAFVPGHLRFDGDAERTLRQMRRAEDLGKVAWIEDSGGVLPRPVMNARGEVSVRELAPGRYELHTQLDREGWVVTSIPFWHGWRATTGGRPLDLRYANHAFVAVHAPPGEARIALEFLPESFRLGLRLSGLGATLLLGMSAATPVRHVLQARRTAVLERKEA